MGDAKGSCLSEPQQCLKTALSHGKINEVTCVIAASQNATLLFPRKAGSPSHLLGNGLRRACACLVLCHLLRSEDLS